MQNNNLLTKALAVSGTILAWLPLLAPVLFSAARMLRAGFFRFDYLLPAELFPIALVGGGLLIWAAVCAHSHQKLIGWGLGIAAGLLAAGQVLAVVTGLASGEMQPAGWWWALVLASLVGYSLMLVLIGVGGILLLADLFGAHRLKSGSL